MLTTLFSLTATLFLALSAALAGPPAGRDAPCAECAAAAEAAAAVPLSAAEKADLLYMREEEKLARDVYTAFYARYGLRVFSNIAASEQAHMDAIGRLLARYNLSDPAAGKAPGVFTNPALQALYDDLIARGNQSLAEALRVGVLIEETDIADLQTSLAHTTNADLRLVYTNLLRASRNHLAAFSRQLR